MNTKHLLIATAALALTGCGGIGMGPRATGVTQRCSGTCDVVVPVALAADGCKIGPLSADIIRVGPQAQGTMIKWQIPKESDSQFKFRQGDAIAFDKPSGAPPSTIMQNGNGAGQAVTVHDKHTGAATYGSWDYTIYVTGNGSVACKFDPTVINDDGTSTY